MTGSEAALNRRAGESCAIARIDRVGEETIGERARQSGGRRRCRPRAQALEVFADDLGGTLEGRHCPPVLSVAAVVAAGDE